MQVRPIMTQAQPMMTGAQCWGHVVKGFLDLH